MKLSFSDALDLITDGRSVSAADVQSRALSRTVWLAEWHFPGCLPETQSYCTTKRNAIDAALSMAEGCDGPPRGMRADLLRYGRSDRVAPDAWAQGAITTIERLTLGELL